MRRCRRPVAADPRSVDHVSHFRKATSNHPRLAQSGHSGRSSEAPSIGGEPMSNPTELGPLFHREEIAARLQQLGSQIEHQ